MSVRATRIGDVTTVVAGGTPARGVAAFYGGSIPWVKTLDLNCGTVLASEECITTEGLRSIRGEINPPGTVMVAMYGGAGTIGKSGLLGVEAATNQAVASILPNPAAFDPGFLHYQLMHLRGEWMQFSQGNRKDPNINKSVVEDMLIWLPDDTNIQRGIALGLKDQLAEVDAAKVASQARASDIGVLRCSVLADLFSAVVHAPRLRLGSFAHTTSGSTPARGVKAYWSPAEIPWVKTGEIDFAPITKVGECISRAALAECSLALLPPKTVLVAITGEGKTRGRSAVLEVQATTNQHSVSILPNETWDPYFLQLWLQASYQDLRELSEGRGGSRSALSGIQIKALEVPAPPRDVQMSLVLQAQAALQEVNALADANAAQLVELERLPQRLLAQVFKD